MRDKIILLVEDNEPEATLMCHALKQNGVTAAVTIARDGEQALDVLLTPAGNGNRPPSVVFLDLKLPRVSGFEVLRVVRARETLRMLPIVILSSSGREQDIRNAYLAGANSYVRKPVRFDEFSAAVRQLSEYWLTINESVSV